MLFSEKDLALQSGVTFFTSVMSLSPPQHKDIGDIMLECNLDLLPGTYQRPNIMNVFAESFPFCCVGVGKYIAGDQYFTKRDGLNNFLLIITIDGSGKASFRGRKFQLKEKSAILFDCNILHEYATVEGKSWHFYYLHFKALSLKAYEVLLNLQTPIMLESTESLCQKMDQLYQYVPHMDLSSYAIQSNLISNILTELVCSLNFNKNYSVGRDEANMAELAEFIRNHCAEPLHLADFTKHSNVSKYHLIRVFQNIYGVSPYKYLHLCRIHLAQSYLLNTSISISDISSKVGYNDPVLFIRHFKKFNGVSPGQYRKNPVQI